VIRNIVSFLPVAPEKVPEHKSEAWLKEQTRELEPLIDRVSAGGLFEVVATPQRMQNLLKPLEQFRRRGGRVNGFGYREELIDDERTPVEWFIVHPGGGADGFESLSWDLQDPIEEDDVHLRVRADRMKPGIHLGGAIYPVYVSERFKAIVESHRLTGIEFVWCRDIGKYRAPQWYYPVCRECLGRGVDDPWIDTSKLSGVGLETLDARGRRGQSGASPQLYKRNAGPSEPSVKKLLSLLRSMELLKRPPQFGAVDRYLRKHLARTDFAATIADWSGEDGRFFRHRGLAMNRQARDILKANRIVADENCIPVLVVNRPPKGVENLDRRYGPVEPAFSPEQLKRMREIEAAAWAKHRASPKPRRAPDLARSLSLLRSRKRGAPKCFAKPATPKAIAQAEKALVMKIPAGWQKVLQVSNGGRVDDSPLAADQACLFLSAEKLAKSRQTEAEYYGDIGATLSRSLLLAMQTEIGDSVWLDTAKKKPNGDCRVVLMSHETGDVDREWPTIAEFLEELLTAC